MSFENKKELGISLEWKDEDYHFVHNFSLERLGMYFSKILFKDERIKNPDFLYKFYGKNENSINSLLENYIYFSNPRNFNDPFDCLANREDKIIKNDGIKEHRDNIGICCFSYANDNPLMWGHYANSFTGFCLKFKNENILKSENIAIKSPVYYLKNYQPDKESFNKIKRDINQFEINSEIKENTLKILTMLREYTWKYIDWQYEKEFRAISFNTNKFNNKLNYEKDDLLEIYIGFRMKVVDSKYYSLLLHILKHNFPKTKIFEVSPNPFYVKLDFKEIT